MYIRYCQVINCLLKLVAESLNPRLNSKCQVGCFPWKFVDGESSIARIVAFVEDDRYEKLMAKKAKCELPDNNYWAVFSSTSLMAGKQIPC